MILWNWTWAIVFWLSSLAVVYTFIGYGVLITLLARFRQRPVRREPITPTVTLIIPAFDEERVIAEKLDNCMALDYPRDRLEIIVVADGSTDRTCAIVGEYASRGIRLLHQPERCGKIAAMNRAAPFASGKVLVFSDANAMLEPQAIRMLVANLADPQVVCVSGEKRIRSRGTVQAEGEGAYWRYEAYLKRLDSSINTAIGAIGELFAIRREYYQPMDDDLLIEDFVLGMRLIAQGWRVLYEPGAVTWEDASPSLGAEWRRRVRMAVGGFQAIGRLRHLLNPFQSLAAFQFVSHKVLRWCAPFFMIAAFVANAMLLHLMFYRLLMAAQSVLYLGVVTGYVLLRFGVHWFPAQALFYFFFANAASLVGFVRYVTHSQPVTWVKAR